MLGIWNLRGCFSSSFQTYTSVIKCLQNSFKFLKDLYKFTSFCGWAIMYTEEQCNMTRLNVGREDKNESRKFHMVSLAWCSILWSILCFYTLAHVFLFFYHLQFLLRFRLSLHHLSAAALLPAFSLSLSLSLVIYFLVTVVTWLWWLDPGLVAVRGESFWPGTDRPWTYCMRPCRLQEKTHSHTTLHEWKHIGRLRWKSLHTLKVVAGWCCF